MPQPKRTEILFRNVAPLYIPAEADPTKAPKLRVSGLFPGGRVLNQQPTGRCWFGGLSAGKNPVKYSFTARQVSGYARIKGQQTLEEDDAAEASIPYQKYLRESGNSFDEERANQVSTRNFGKLWFSGRFQCAESEFQVKTFEILHPNLENKENHRKDAFLIIFG